MTTITLLQHIKDERKKRKITQDEFATRLSMCRDRYIGIESGHKKLSLNELCLILQLLDIELHIQTKTILT